MLWNAIAATTAKTAGFNGVEIHNANGYLLDQFLRDGTNQRTDEYGGPARNRARLTLEVADAVTQIWARIAWESFSPGGVFNDMDDSNPLETFGHVLHELNRLKLACAHFICPRMIWNMARCLSCWPHCATNFMGH